MAMTCSSCGGTLVYSITKKKLQCKHCNACFDVESYKEPTEAEKESLIKGQMEMDIYRCNCCGASLTVPQDQLVTYCIYCGSEVTLFEKAGKMQMPQRIVPFSFSKQKAKNAYLKKLEKYRFAPEEFKNPDFLEEFRGIYIPYWRTKTQLNSTHISTKAKHRYYTSDYTYVSTFEIEAQVEEGKIDTGYFDASAEFDDTIAGDIAPFNTNHSKGFKKGYLAGFYADVSTASIDTYKDAVSNQVYETVQKQFERTLGVEQYDKEAFRKKISFGDVETETVLFPVWFLTWRKKDRVAYGVMNGDTGAITMDVPIDFKKFFSVAGIATLVLFLILSSIPTFMIPLHTAKWAVFFAYFTSAILNSELKQLRIRERHVYDLGNTTYKDKKFSLWGKKKWYTLDKVLTWICAAWVGIVLLIETCDTPKGLDIFIGCMLIVQLVSFCKGIRHTSKIQKKWALIPIFLCMLSMFVCSIITNVNRPQDYWAFLTAIIEIVCMLANMVTGIFYTYYLTTRPVPSFFSRKGADHGAE